LILDEELHSLDGGYGVRKKWIEMVQYLQQSTRNRLAMDLDVGIIYLRDGSGDTSH